VCILQGPVAAKWSIKKDEPIKDLLGNITTSLISKVLQLNYSGDESIIPTIEYLAPQPSASSSLSGVTRIQRINDVIYEVGKSLPCSNAWFETLGGAELTWLHALVTSRTILQGTSYIDNPIRRLLAPRSGQRVVVTYEHSSPASVTVFGAARSYGTQRPGFKAVEVQYSASTQLIDITIFEERREVTVPLYLQFVYKPSQGYMPIHEVAVDRNKRIKQFYWKLWYGDNEVLPSVGIKEKFIGPEVTITAEEVEEFCTVVENQGELFKRTRMDTVQVPMDFAIVTGWQVSSRWSPMGNLKLIGLCRLS